MNTNEESIVMYLMNKKVWEKMDYSKALSMLDIDDFISLMNDKTWVNIKEFIKKELEERCRMLNDSLDYLIFMDPSFHNEWYDNYDISYCKSIRKMSTLNLAKMVEGLPTDEYHQYLVLEVVHRKKFYQSIMDKLFMEYRYKTNPKIRAEKRLAIMDEVEVFIEKTGIVQKKDLCETKEEKKRAEKMGALMKRLLA